MQSFYQRPNKLLAEGPVVVQTSCCVDVTDQIVFGVTVVVRGGGDCISKAGRLISTQMVA